jgi:hypothetical protein
MRKDKETVFRIKSNMKLMKGEVKCEASVEIMIK